MKPDKLLAQLIKQYGFELVKELSEYMDENLPLINEIESIEKELLDKNEEEWMKTMGRALKKHSIIEFNEENRTKFWNLMRKGMK